MSNTADTSPITSQQRLSEELVAKASKEQLVECLTLLALNVAHYERRYGENLLMQTVEIASAEKPRPESVRLWNHGFSTLVKVLELVTGGENPGASVH